MVSPSIAPSSSTNRNHIPTEVLRQITHSGFLSSEELGRLLLVSCKSFLHDLGEEDVWQAICETRWRHTSQLPRSFFTPRGFKSYFQQMSAEIPLTYYYNEDGKICWHQDGDRASAASSTTLQVENSFLAVSIRNENGEIYSKTLKGDDLTDFLFEKNGHQKLGLECPIKQLGRIRASKDGTSSTTYKSIDAADLVQHCWSATVHLIRSDTNTCLCIYEATKDYAYKGLHFMSMGFKLGEYPSPGYRVYSKCHWG
jgi:hypothetical protein